MKTTTDEDFIMNLDSEVLPDINRDEIVEMVHNVKSVDPEKAKAIMDILDNLKSTALNSKEHKNSDIIFRSVFLDYCGRMARLHPNKQLLETIDRGMHAITSILSLGDCDISEFHPNLSSKYGKIYYKSKPLREQIYSVLNGFVVPLINMSSTGQCKKYAEEIIGIHISAELEKMNKNKSKEKEESETDAAPVEKTDPSKIDEIMLNPEDSFTQMASLDVDDLFKDEYKMTPKEFLETVEALPLEKRKLVKYPKVLITRDIADLTTYVPYEEFEAKKDKIKS